MEGINFSLEQRPEDDDDDSSIEKKDTKDSKETKRSVFEKSEADEAKKQERPSEDKNEKNTEAPVPLESLAEDEKQQVAAEIVAGLKEDNQQELMQAADNSVEEQEALVGATFAEALEQELEDSTPVEEALEVATEKTQEVAELSAIDTAAETEPDDDNEEDVTAATSPTTPTATTAAGTGITPPSPPAPPASPGSIGGAGAPPPPGGIPGGRAIPGAPFGPGSVSTFSGANFNAAPSMATAPPADVIEVRNRRRERSNLLVGGIIGYMIGRRRGRIKTEKKLIPVQEKLEKQVKTLEHTILDREQKLRAAARERFEQNPASAKRTIERMEELHALRQAEKKTDTGVERTVAMKKPEKLGKFAVLAEKPATVMPEKQKPVDLMSVPELLEVAAHIKIEQSSIKRLYEVNHLNDEGLRRVVKAYLRGERHDRILLENLLSPEIKRTPIDDKTPETDSATAALRQALADQGGANFALPSLNNPSQPSDHSTSPIYQPTPKRTNTKLVARSAVVVIGILLLLLLTR